jgi:hypothetical protein
MVKSYEKQAKSKADIAKENREKNLERASGGGGIHAGKSKDKIAKEKSLVTKQNIKEKKKATTPSEKKDLDATQKRESTHPIHKKKDRLIELKKEKKDKSGSLVKKIKKIFTGNGKAEAATEIGKGGKSPGPKERKKLSEMSAKEKARIAKKKADAKAKATREDARKPKKKEAKKQAETGTRETSYEARVKALVAKKASLSKKETADGRSEYQVQMNKLKKENKKAWKKMFKGGKLKG